MATMRDLFKENYHPTPEDFKKLWDSCIFVFDANVLLDMYRCTEKTKNDFFDVLKIYSSRIWMPYQVCTEFFSNRISVIVQQTNACDKAIGVLEEIVADSNDKLSTALNFRKHPFIDKNNILSQLQGGIDSIKQNIISQRDTRYSSIGDIVQSDSVLAQIESIFGDNVGAIPPDIDKAKACIDGRYKEKIPPGYMDVKTKGEGGAHGDCLIWFELIEKSKNDKKPIVFVTSDQKEDWWLRISGKYFGCRPELTKEFSDKTGGESFYMYTLDRFLEYAKRNTEVNIDLSSIDELKDIVFQRPKDDEILFSLNIYFHRLNHILAGYLSESEELDLFQMRFLASKRGYLSRARYVRLMSSLRNTEAAISARFKDGTITETVFDKAMQTIRLIYDEIRAAKRTIALKRPTYYEINGAGDDS